MDYQHKYFKYKSKYLEKKYGHQFKFRYKIDYDNDLDYKQKYFKYKSKYLSLKYGGAPTVDRNARNRSNVKTKTSYFPSIPSIPSFSFKKKKKNMCE